MGAEVPETATCRHVWLTGHAARPRSGKARPLSAGNREVRAWQRGRAFNRRKASSRAAGSSPKPCALAQAITRTGSSMDPLSRPFNQLTHGDGLGDGGSPCAVAARNRSESGPTPCRAGSDGVPSVLPRRSHSTLQRLHQWRAREFLRGILVSPSSRRAVCGPARIMGGDGMAASRFLADDRGGAGRDAGRAGPRAASSL